MHIADMEMRVRDIFPNCTFDEDNYGQIVIYTDMMVDNNTLVPFEEE
jgi:hypothetical protein